MGLCARHTLARPLGERGEGRGEGVGVGGGRGCMEGKKAGARLIIRPTDAVTMPQNAGHARCLIYMITIEKVCFH